MKRFLVQCLMSAISLIIIPLSVFAFTDVPSIPSDSSGGNITSADKLSSTEEDTSAFIDDSTIRVFNADTNTVMELDFRDYIIGVVAAEMPVEFHSEALSAGTVAAATLARKKLKSGSDDELSGAVISTDPAKHQAYMTTDDMKSKWGNDFDKYYKKLTEAVDKAIDYSIVYKGELIVAAYHAISPGKTENAENIWSASYPYLVSVESEGDSLSPKYESEVSISTEEFKEKLTAHGAVFDADGEIQIKDSEYTDSGTLKKINIGNKDFSGKELREIFSLRSPAVTVNKTDEEIAFNVKGYGHGVGMSQYGADYYARQGMTWQEIIKHYYTNTEIIIYRADAR